MGQPVLLLPSVIKLAPYIPGELKLERSIINPNKHFNPFPDMRFNVA